MAIDRMFGAHSKPEQLVEECLLLSLSWKLIVHLNWELEEDVPWKVHLT